MLQALAKQTALDLTRSCSPSSARGGTSTPYGAAALWWWSPRSVLSTSEARLPTRADAEVLAAASSASMALRVAPNRRDVGLPSGLKHAASHRLHSTAHRLERRDVGQ